MLLYRTTVEVRTLSEVDGVAVISTLARQTFQILDARFDPANRMIRAQVCDRYRGMGVVHSKFL
jgi:hypothetical protein